MKKTKKKLELTTTTIKVLTDKQLQSAVGGNGGGAATHTVRYSDERLKRDIAPL